jgi:hypothetical protein
MTIKELLTWATVGVQFVAAFLWFASTRVKVTAESVVAEYQKVHGPNSGPAQIVSEDGSDFTATAERQSRWSGWAAITTGVGLSIQAIAAALPSPAQ